MNAAETADNQPLKISVAWERFQLERTLKMPQETDTPATNPKPLRCFSEGTERKESSNTSVHQSRFPAENWAKGQCKPACGTTRKWVESVGHACQSKASRSEAFVFLQVGSFIAQLDAWTVVFLGSVAVAAQPQYWKTNYSIIEFESLRHSV